jgi:hypothetical protein
VAEPRYGFSGSGVNHLATFRQADYALLVTIFVLVIGEKI